MTKSQVLNAKAYQPVIERCRNTVAVFHSAEPLSERRQIAGRMPFINREKHRIQMERLLSNATTEQDRADIRKFMGISPFEMAKLEEWSERRVPRALRHMITTPMDEFTFRLQFFLECIDPSFFKTLSDYLKAPYAEKEFTGASVIVDQSNSSQGQKGLDPLTIKKTTDMMHLYFRATMAVYRLMQDVLVGDAISLDGKAPEDNPTVVAVEAARFLLTMKTL